MQSKHNKTNVPECNIYTKALKTLTACFGLFIITFIISVMLSETMYDNLDKAINVSTYPRMIRQEGTAPKEKYDATYFTELESRMRNATTVIYNRVPKCASTATKNTIFRIAKATGAFRYYSSHLYHTEHLGGEEKVLGFIRQVTAYKEPWLFERHLHFVNFNQSGFPMPIYINMVRDPVQRFVSEYYFHRFEHPKPMTNERRNRPFDECVMGNYSECSTASSFKVIPFFCGQNDLCLSPSKEALQLAKENVDAYYGVVGLAEELIPSYKLMETTMPQFFSNMSAIAQTRLAKMKSAFKTHKKPKPSEKAVTIMKSRLTLEYEFYDFIKYRFNKFLKHYQLD